MPPVSLTQFLELNNVVFDNMNLLRNALVHPSYLNEHPECDFEHNERLEFLGDAVLDFISGELLYNQFPDSPEGRLTRLRAAVVRTETLAEFAVTCHIGEALLLGRGEEESGGRSRRTILCAGFEAFIGALYLDQGMQAVRNFALPHIEESIRYIIKKETEKDAKSRLQEFCQAQLGMTPTYKTVDETGPDHEKTFTIAVFIQGMNYAEGIGPSKQTAAQAAAAIALVKLESESDNA